MFMVYGVTGLTFQGPLEEYNRVHAIGRTAGVRKVVAKGDDREKIGYIDKPNAAAIKAYTERVQPDLERGPLYHASEIMVHDVITLQAEDSVAHAFKVICDHKIHQAPVLDTSKKLVGIVSDRDLLTVINVDHGKILDVMHRQVKDVMTSPVVAADPVTDIRRIAKVMLEGDVDGVPIIDDKHALVGFISRSDILQAVTTDPPVSLWR
ncbi:MAG TPA: CBS domain-containing protein [Methylophilaceae bacterium]|jgi:CBS-domain-containing membrane protein